jgi:hypothetical protein
VARRADAHIGARFGRLTVTGETERRNGNAYTPVRCDCGAKKTIRTCSLGASANSCGCLRKEDSSARFRTHGSTGTSEYRIWHGMKWRCRNHPTYLGRGITVADRWLVSFEAFLADVGPRPSSKHTLDRLDNDGNYEPGNVAWRTYAEQNRNRRPQLRETCINDHARSPENVRVQPNGARACRVCDRDRQQAKRDAQSTA